MRRLVVVVMVALIVTGVTACGGDEPSAQRAPDMPETTTTTGFGPLGTDAKGVPTTVKRGELQTPTTEAGRPRRPGVPLPGRYMYSTGPDEDDLKALDLVENPEENGEIAQMETWTDMSTMVRRVVYWRPEIKILDREQHAVPDQRGDVEAGPLCDFAPDLPHLKLPVAVGVSWSGKATCQQDERVKERSVTAKVTATDTITVQGEAVPVFVIERTVHDVTPTELGPAERKTIATEFYSVPHGLVVRSRATVEQLFAGKSSTTTANLDIHSVHPSPFPTS